MILFIFLLSLLFAFPVSRLMKTTYRGERSFMDLMQTESVVVVC